MQHDVLTDSLTRQSEVGETCHNAGDGDQLFALDSKTRCEPGDRKTRVVVLITQRSQVHVLPPLLVEPQVMGMIVQDHSRLVPESATTRAEVC